MDRSIPCGSKICARRAEQRRHELHRRRVRNVKPLVNTTEPEVSHMDHLKCNMKREQLLEERYSEIDRENRILLKKMSDIMRQPPTRDQPPSLGPPSLNRDARKKELLRITKENQSILRRIQQAQPVYNHVEWEGSRRRNEAYLQNCAEYPLVLRGRRKPNISSELAPMEGGDAYGAAPHTDRSHLVSSGLQQEMGTSDDARYVLKEGMRISDAFYLVEMSTDGRALQISAYEGNSKTALDLLINERTHRKVYREAGGDYSQIAQRLRVEDGRLVLDEGATEHAPVSPQPITPQAMRSTRTDELDADAMVVYKCKPMSAGSVEAEIDMSSTTGDARFRLRGLTPSSDRHTPMTAPS